MGQGSSNPTESHELNSSHPKFTSGKFITSGKGRHMQTTMGIDNKDFDKWSQQIKKDKPSPEFLLLPVHEDFSTKGLCGSSGTLTLDYEDFPYLLTEQLANRKGKKKFFQENQLWYLLFCLISAKRSMIPAFSKIGDVRPQNIFINDKGNVKVTSIYSWPKEATNYIKSLDHEVTYLAPQQVRQLEQGALESSDSSRSQIFSIGLTLLSAATLEDFESCYDVKKFSINLRRIEEKLNQFKSSGIYSQIFKATVCNLCDFDQNKRVQGEQLYNWIIPHEASIRARENFVFPSAPQKIDQQVHIIRQILGHFGGLRQQSVPVVPNGLNTVVGSSLTGQKIVFPPQIIRSSVPTVTAGTSLGVPAGYTSFTNFQSVPMHMQAQSIYVPASTVNQRPNVNISASNNTGVQEASKGQETDKNQADGNQTK